MSIWSNRQGFEKIVLKLFQKLLTRKVQAHTRVFGPLPTLRTTCIYLRACVQVGVGKKDNVGAYACTYSLSPQWTNGFILLFKSLILPAQIELQLRSKSYMYIHAPSLKSHRGKPYAGEDKYQYELSKVERWTWLSYLSCCGNVCGREFWMQVFILWLCMRFSAR